MFSCESVIAICMILVVFLAGIGAVLGCVDYMNKYDETTPAEKEEEFFTNAEVMRVAQVIFGLIE